jgi:hypothetical protein
MLYYEANAFEASFARSKPMKQMLTKLLGGLHKDVMA